jgi:Ca2+-binding RTX toxin-like protein
VQSSVTRSLGGNQDNLILTGTSAIKGTGNNLSNILTGNSAVNTLTGNAGNDTLDGGAGNDLLKGGLGNDTLIGGDGADFFLFNTDLDAGNNIDVITDFVSGTDKIRLDDDIFLAFDATVSGTLTTIQLYVASGATTAQDAFDRVIYNTSTGALYYDEDGLGGVSSIQFAILGTSIHPGLATGDFQLIN